MIPPRQFRRHGVRPVLEHLARTEPRLDSRAAEDLLLGTALMESGLREIEQRGGPALGFFQIEPATFADVYDRYLTQRRPDLLITVDGLSV